MANRPTDEQNVAYPLRPTTVRERPQNTMQGKRRQTTNDRLTYGLIYINYAQNR